MDSNYYLSQVSTNQKTMSRIVLLKQPKDTPYHLLTVPYNTLTRTLATNYINKINSLSTGPITAM